VQPSFPIQTRFKKSASSFFFISMTHLCTLLLLLLSTIQVSNANTWGGPRIHPAIQMNMTDAEPPKYKHLSKRVGCSDDYFLCRSEDYVGCCPNGSLCDRSTAQCSIGTCGPTGHVCPFYGCCYAGQYCGNDGWCYPMNSTATGLPSTDIVNPTYQASVATSAPTRNSAGSHETAKIGRIGSILWLLITILVV
jgi:hypothetical protein